MLAMISVAFNLTSKSGKGSMAPATIHDFSNEELQLQEEYYFFSHREHAHLQQRKFYSRVLAFCEGQQPLREIYDSK